VSAGSGGADEVFRALGDATRRQVLREIASHGPLTATQLAGSLPITRQAVTKHLGVLDAAGLVASHREGREIRYEATTAPLDQARAWLDEVGEQWDERLHRLKARLQREPS